MTKNNYILKLDSVGKFLVLNDTLIKKALEAGLIKKTKKEGIFEPTEKLSLICIVQ